MTLAVKSPKPLTANERKKIKDEIRDHFELGYYPGQEFSDKFKIKIMRLALSVR